MTGSADRTGERFILALDQGTTSSRALVFDQSGNVRARAQRETSQHYPRPGWVEQDPQEIWTSQLAVASEAIRASGVGPTDIAGIGVTNQRETTIVWNRSTGEPVYSAIVWQDRRTAGEIDRLKEQGLEPVFIDTTGLVLDAYFSASKIHWILQNIDGAREQARRGDLLFGTVDTWILWNLSGRALHVTDVSNASRTLLFNLRHLRWDDALLRIWDIPEIILPEVRASSEVFGETDANLFGARIPLAGVAGDQQAASLGQALFDQGQVKCTYGTGSFLLMNTGRRIVPSSRRLLTTLAWMAGGTPTYALEGSIFVGGAVIQWLRDQLGVIRTSGEIEALARSVPDNGGVYFVPAFTGLGAPHWDQYARGTIVGLTRGSSAAHLARAALESIAFQVFDVANAMEADCGDPIPELRADGGAAANDLLLQFQADLLGFAVVRPEIIETTALGAAYLAGLATGVWGDLEEISRQWRLERRFEPSMDESNRVQLLDRWHQAVGRSARWEPIRKVRSP